MIRSDGGIFVDESLGEITARYFSVGRTVINCSNKIVHDAFGFITGYSVNQTPSN
jgi:hypothetical protein